MPSEIEEIKSICKEYLKSLNIMNFTIIFARRMNGYWKVVVRYSKKNNPEINSSILINWATKKVDGFQEGIITL